jgi:hypothetical protein
MSPPEPEQTALGLDAAHGHEAGCGHERGAVDGPVVEPWVALGTELLVDLPGVKCWQERVEPGQSRPLHTHRHPWVTVVVAGAEGESKDAEGKVLVSGRVAAGTVRYNDVSILPFTHSLTNTSGETLVMVAVELREPPATPGSSDGRGAR